MENRVQKILNKCMSNTLMALILTAIKLTKKRVDNRQELPIQSLLQMNNNRFIMPKNDKILQIQINPDRQSKEWANLLAKVQSKL